MDKVYKLAIIGGGAAGLLAAAEAVNGINAFRGEDVIIVERGSRVGRKLLATGNGQGNLTNADLSEKFYHGEKSFIGAFIENAKNLGIIGYLADMGVFLTEGEDGKKYPLSMQASSVLDIFRAFLAEKSVAERTDFWVKKLSFSNGKYVIESSESKILAEKVILCTGGKAAKQFGTDGTSYALAQSFGHTLTPLFPSLVQIKTEKDKIKGLKGIKAEAVVKAKSSGKTLAESRGDVLFTDFGVSGDAIFKVSGYLTDAVNPSIELAFLPDLTEEQTAEIIDKRIALSRKDGTNVLLGILNKRLSEAVLKTAAAKDAQSIASALKRFTLKAEGNLGFDYAQTTRGGIRTEDVNPKTYESLLRKGLYLCGEILNVDGDCGGYNLTFAFVSGVLAARAVKKSFD